MPGMRPEQVADYFAVAAAFFERAAWKRLGYEAAIRVEWHKYEGGPWYSLVIGHSPGMVS